MTLTKKKAQNAKQAKATNIYPSLAGKNVIVTGGATGIGAALVRAFARQGAHVSFLDLLADSASSVIKDMENEAVAMLPTFYQCDVANTDDLQRCLGELTLSLGQIHVLINNAASDDRHTLAGLSGAEWDQLASVNLKHAFFAAQTVAEHMQQHRTGCILNLGSISWRTAKAGLPAYLAFKAGLEGMTRGLARELGQHQIRVNTIVPGWVLTDKQEKIVAKEGGLDAVLSQQCIAEPLKPQDICAMALFLSSDDAALCTAQHFVVDAGLS